LTLPQSLGGGVSKEARKAAIQKANENFNEKKQK